MIIIVEGIDRVGKSTLCKMISDEYKIPTYTHIGKRDFSKINNDIETDKFFQILEICKLSNSFIVFDRLYFSDYIYGLLERNYDKDNADKNFSNLDIFIEKNLSNAILILVVPTDIESSSKEHGKSLNEHNRLFLEKFAESRIKNKIKCDYCTLNDAVRFIKSKISKCV